MLYNSSLRFSIYPTRFEERLALLEDLFSPSPSPSSSTKYLPPTLLSLLKPKQLSPQAGELADWMNKESPQTLVLLRRAKSLYYQQNSFFHYSVCILHLFIHLFILFWILYNQVLPFFLLSRIPIIDYHINSTKGKVPSSMQLYPTILLLPIVSLWEENLVLAPNAKYASGN